MSAKRALHFVLKVGNLKKNVEFFRDKFKMVVLRHEVFDKGCEAACNGPYDGKWSKTMIGYGPEDDHFVLELTYNYSIGSYKLGNDLNHIKIGVQDDVYKSIKSAFQESFTTTTDELSFVSPDGYKFLINRDEAKNDVKEVALAVTDLEASVAYWSDLLGMKLTNKTDQAAQLSYDDSQAKLKLVKIQEQLDHKSAFGRIAFSCPANQLKAIQKAAEDNGRTVLTPYLSLDTPGKATVQVVILADPDGHEICFVGDEGFRQLSQVDPEANNLIEKSIADDKSDEWYQNKNKSKQEA